MNREFTVGQPCDHTVFVWTTLQEAAGDDESSDDDMPDLEEPEAPKQSSQPADDDDDDSDDSDMPDLEEPEAPKVGIRIHTTAPLTTHKPTTHTHTHAHYLRSRTCRTFVA
jgi:hypothetical protein